MRKGRMERQKGGTGRQKVAEVEYAVKVSINDLLKFDWK